MAQFFTDFSEYTADAQPSDWTERWNTGDGVANVRDSGIPSGASVSPTHALQVDVSDARYAISWDAVGTPSGDVEVLSLCYSGAISTANSVIRTLLQGSGTAGSEQAYFSDPQFGTSTEVQITRYSDSGDVQLGTSDEGLTTGEWIWFRLQRTSSDNGIRLRAWADGDTEPGTWSIDVTDATLSGGWIGFGAFRDDGNWFAQIGVGTGGDEAPSGPLIGIDSVTPSTFADGDTGVTIAGEGFEASQGTGKVELGDDSDYATATLVEQTVESWSDTSIDFTVDQGALNSGTVYVFVTNDSGSTTDGFEAHIIHELSATSAGTSTVSVALSVTRSLSAASAGPSEVSAALLAIRQFSAQSDGVSTVSADLVIDEATVELAATIAGQSTVSADLAASFVLSATSAGVSTASADLLAIRNLSAALAGESTFSAELLRTRTLAAAISAQSTVTALLAGGSIVTYVPPGIAQTTKPPSGIAQTTKPPSGIAQTTKPPQPGHARFR